MSWHTSKVNIPIAYTEQVPDLFWSFSFLYPKSRSATEELVAFWPVEFSLMILNKSKAALGIRIDMSAISTILDSFQFKQTLPKYAFFLEIE